MDMASHCRTIRWFCSVVILIAVYLIVDGGVAAPSFRPRRLKPPFPHIRTSQSDLSSISYETRYFTQTLDHFSFRPNTTTFQQRYLLNSDNWSGPGAPIFVYCGNEGTITWFAENTGFIWELAPVFGALVLFPEHRYYGESMPFGSEEAAYKDADSLAYLTAEQALADFVLLLREIKLNMSAESSPVVLFGGSYGGMLAAWMRLKYPHVAVGAIASSAPILQFEDLVPMDSYYKIVSNDFKKESVECFEVIKQSWDIIEMIGQTEEGLQNLTEKFKLCSKLKSVSSLEDWIFSAYSYLAMVNYPYAADFVMPLPPYPIREVCKAITTDNYNLDILSRIFAGVNVFYNYTGSATCFDVDEDIDGISGWDWQACTEMIMPMSSNPNNSMFPPGAFDLESYEISCFNQYGVNPRPTWITSEFGGHNITEVLRKFGSNIVFSNGLVDPWSGGGVLQNISSTIVALVTEEGAHHLDLRFSTEYDPSWLIYQRQAEVQHIKQWLTDYYQENQDLSKIQMVCKASIYNGLKVHSIESDATVRYPLL